MAEGLEARFWAGFVAEEVRCFFAREPEDESGRAAPAFRWDRGSVRLVIGPFDRVCLLRRRRGRGCRFGLLDEAVKKFSSSSCAETYTWYQRDVFRLTPLVATSAAIEQPAWTFKIGSDLQINRHTLRRSVASPPIDRLPVG
jgi:hypothetical protein